MWLAKTMPAADVASDTCLAFRGKTSGKLVSVAEAVRHMHRRGYPRSQLDRGCTLGAFTFLGTVKQKKRDICEAIFVSYAFIYGASKTMAYHPHDVHAWLKKYPTIHTMEQLRVFLEEWLPVQATKLPTHKREVYGAYTKPWLPTKKIPSPTALVEGFTNWVLHQKWPIDGQIFKQRVTELPGVGPLFAVFFTASFVNLEIVTYDPMALMPDTIGGGTKAFLRRHKLISQKSSNDEDSFSAVQKIADFLHLSNNIDVAENLLCKIQHVFYEL